MIDFVRAQLRRQRWWLELRELQREGLAPAWRRSRAQRAIECTPPVITDMTGRVELRVLTWRRDWRNALWALKTFYAYAGVRYPLYIHDGGWLSSQAKELQRHFPNATLVGWQEADRTVEPFLEEHGYLNSLRYRRKNGLTRQLFDFFLLSQAEYVVILGSDLLFFRPPEELLVPHDEVRANRYARDSDYFYSMTLDEIERASGVRPPPYFNTGPSLVRRGSIDFAMIDRCLGEPKMFDDNWVTEQTLHAICGTLHGGADYLPSTYAVEPHAAGPAALVCKHYPGGFRQRLYDEGMAYLLQQGFIGRLQAMFGA
jgi:hypothetical protein